MKKSKGMNFEGIEEEWEDFNQSKKTEKTRINYYGR